MIRRLFVPSLAAILVVGIVAAMAPAETEARKRMVLGVSNDRNTKDIQVVKDFAKQTGDAIGSGPIKPRMWTIWSKWGDPATKSFPTVFADELRDYGVTPMIWWEPMRKRTKADGSFDCAYAKHRQIARGKYNWYIKKWARAAKRHGGKVILRFAQEINGSYFPWGIGNCGNTARAFKRAYRHVHHLVRNVIGAKNVLFVQTWTSKSCRGCNGYRATWVGDRHTEMVGFSVFNWGNHEGRSWRTMEQSIKKSMNWVSQLTRKPVLIVEVGTNHTGGPSSTSADKPEWIRTGYSRAYRTYPRIRGMSYLNIDLSRVGHPDWSLYTPKPQALQAYASIANQYRFKGKFR